MTSAQPVLSLPSEAQPFGAIVARQLSVWPFAARTARLFVLVDPPPADAALAEGLLRAMQQAYFASDGYSQTRAVTEATLAAHYVLRHHNRDVLRHEQDIAAAAVAAIRGNIVYIALAGQAAAFAWRGGQLTGQRGVPRLPRPLGLVQDPSITLWSTPLDDGDRLVLVCGATWRPNSAQVLSDVLSSADSTLSAEQQLAEGLRGPEPASVLAVGPDTQPTKATHLRLLPRPEMAPEQPRGASASRWLTSLLGLVLLAAVAVGAFKMSNEPSGQVAVAAPQMLQLVERIDRVSPQMAVRLGPSATNVVDLAVGDNALYTLDVGESAVRVFALDGVDQQPTPDTVIAAAGTPLDARGQRLGVPVAIEYVDGALAVVDQSRSVIQIDHDRRLSLRSLPASATWLAVSALGADASGHLLFVDSAARRVLQYPALGQGLVDAPRVVLDPSIAPSIDFARLAEIVSADGVLIVRLDDGRLLRLAPDGSSAPLDISSVHGEQVLAGCIASDRNGGIYVADPANARILQVTAGGSILRELRDPALGGVRRIESSRDGRNVYGLVASGVLVFDTPDL
jgi:hypothetical protein